MERNQKIFVGGLPVRIDKDVIVDFFSKYGTVLNCKLKKNQQTGRSLGFAYIHLKEKHAYDKLLNERVEFMGRVIEIKPMWKKRELGDRLEVDKRKKLFVSNIPQDITNHDLIAYFTKFGGVSNAFIIKDPDSNRNKNYGYVIFKEVDDFEQVFEYRKPHYIRPGWELKLERCLNLNEIAQLKQAVTTSPSLPCGSRYGQHSGPVESYSRSLCTQEGNCPQGQLQKLHPKTHNDSSTASPRVEGSTASQIPEVPPEYSKKISSFLGSKNVYKREKPLNTTGKTPHSLADQSLQSGFHRVASQACSTGFILKGRIPLAEDDSPISCLCNEQLLTLNSIGSCSLRFTPMAGVLSASRQLNEKEANYLFRVAHQRVRSG